MDFGPNLEENYPRLQKLLVLVGSWAFNPTRLRFKAQAKQHQKGGGASNLWTRKVASPSLSLFFSIFILYGCMTLLLCGKKTTTNFWNPLGQGRTVTSFFIATLRLSPDGVTNTTPSSERQCNPDFNSLCASFRYQSSRAVLDISFSF